MTVTEALKILQSAPKDREPFRCFLACGFTPLHLQLFLNARLQETRSDRRVEIPTGLFGNLAGTLENLGEGDADAVAVAIEWPDLDPRLGYREAGSWGLDAAADTVANARVSLSRIRQALARIPAGVRIALSAPTLPLPPVFHTSGRQAGAAELLLEASVTQFVAEAAERRDLVVVNARRLAEKSPVGERLDLKADLSSGIPYSLPHADAMAETFARLLLPEPPKKGIITDLDDTLWHGIVGDVGPDGVHWDLANHHPLHGLYQKLLSSLADAGVLIAIASKNDAANVAQAMKRPDLLIRSGQMFPHEVHWDRKSSSVERILRAWNISADTVIFVDDSPLELAEVEAAHPGITPIRFPVGKPQEGLAFLRRLRDLCGKEQISADDSLRLASIRQGAVFAREAYAGSTPDDFLRAAGSHIEVEFGGGADDSRALELVNKTNQFNINGGRFTSSEWKRSLMAPGSFSMTISYSDRFGSLGKIGVVRGRSGGNRLDLETWVLSCRAFGRRIEHRCLQLLFDRFGTSRIDIDFQPTAKNGPAQDFFEALKGARPQGPFPLTRAEFDEKCPPLYHQVGELERVQTNG